jgi:curli production assembly/transport component CsgG
MCRLLNLHFENMKKLLLIGLIILTGCSAIRPWEEVGIRSPARITKVITERYDNIKPIDGPPLTVAVYSFIDKTGQRKPSSTLSLFSTAVSQGADSYVIKSLREVCKGKWFRVVERGGIDNLIKERQIIKQTREIFGDKKELGPLLYAGLILEGGIIGYDSNTRTGGAGVAIFNIGPYTQYSQDMVIINMRLVSVQTGEVLASVTVEKNILSTSDGVSTMRFFNMGTGEYEVEVQQTYNEPISYATRSAIETGIMELIEEGVKTKLWKYKE